MVWNKNVNGNEYLLVGSTEESADLPKENNYTWEGKRDISGDWFCWFW